MTTTLYAQPYSLVAAGFYFKDAETFATKSAALRNDYGESFEEFEIQFIDGEAIDAELAKAIGLYQGDVAAFFDKIEEWDEHQKRNVIIAVGESGYQFGWRDDPDTLDVDIYEMASLRELAEHFIEEELYGPELARHAHWLDFEAIGRDLGMEFVATSIAGQSLVYRCA